MRDHLVRSVLPKIDVARNSGPCGWKRYPYCDLCKLMKRTSTFKERNSYEIYHIYKQFNCNSYQYILQNVINVGNNTRQFQNHVSYKSTHRKFKNKKQVPKKL